MLRKILFFVFIALWVRSIYYCVKLYRLELDKLNAFGQGAFLGYLLLFLTLTAVLFLLGRRIWFTSK